MKKLALILGTVLCITSCSKDEIAVEYGSAKLSIEQGASVFVKGTSTTTPASDTYIVYTTKESSRIEELSGTYGSLKDKSITVPVGEYKVEAYNIAEDKAEEGRGEQRFYGTETLNVTAGNLSNVSLTCKMANARVSFVFDESFKNLFNVNHSTTPAKIVATSAANTSRKITYDNTTTLEENNGQIAYFNVVADNNALNFEITAVRKSDSQTKTYTQSINLQAQSWHKITIKASATSGQAGIGIVVDEAITSVEKDITVNPYEE